MLIVYYHNPTEIVSLPLLNEDCITHIGKLALKNGDISVAYTIARLNRKFWHRFRFALRLARCVKQSRAIPDVAAAKHGYLDVLKWLENKGKAYFFFYSSPAKESGMRDGNVELLEWVRQKYNDHRVKFSIDVDVVNKAIDNGRVDSLRWLASWDPRAITRIKHALCYAMCEGQLETLKYLHEELGMKNICKTDMNIAIERGHSKTLEYANAHYSEFRVMREPTLLENLMRPGSGLDCLIL